MAGTGASNPNGLATGQVWGRKNGPMLYQIQSVNTTSGDAMCKDLNGGGLKMLANSVFNDLERKN